VLAAIAVLALLVSVAIVTAPSATAASNADYVGLGDHATITGRVGGSGSWQGYLAGEMLLAIDGGETMVGYCIDLHTSISEQTGNDLAEVAWTESGIANLNQVSYVLNTYEPGSALLPGTADEKAAAIQAAIWHLTDGFDLRTSGNPAAVIAGYDTILASIPVDGLPVEPAPSLAITPATLTAYAGEVAGPFTVDTTGSALPMVIPAGVGVVDWITRQPMTTVSDGDVFGIVGEQVGSVEVSVTATATIHAGRVFARLDDQGNPVVQRLILAQRSEASTTASVSAEFGEPPTTTTTVPPTTTTTVEETTTTTVEDTTTTTEGRSTTTTVGDTTTTEGQSTTTTDAEVLGSVIDNGSLPRTGADSGWLVGASVASIFIGLLAVAGKRRWEVTHA
jgi:hypothetical protein